MNKLMAKSWRSNEADYLMAENKEITSIMAWKY